eukprot:GEMP01000170.1.p1 GENE.GEMP01000170.1~~GEMP01000170.1.p1  ORF type:complete len:2577 (+),score=424.69 GEMP01000170.1:72-7802(+)
MLRPVHLWLFLQHVTWVIFCAPFADLAEGSVIGKNYSSDMDIFANWIKNIEGRVMPILCPVSASSPWPLRSLSMFRDYMPEEDVNYLPNKCYREGCHDEIQNGPEDGFDCGSVCGKSCADCEDDDTGIADLWGSDGCADWTDYCEDGLFTPAHHVKTMREHCPASCGLCEKAFVDFIVQSGCVDRTSEFSRDLPFDDSTSANAENCKEECLGRDNCVAFEYSDQSGSHVNCTLYSDVEITNKCDSARKLSDSAQKPKLRLFIWNSKTRRTSSRTSASTPSSSSTSPPPPISQAVTCASHTESSASKQCHPAQKGGRARKCKNRPCTREECCDDEESEAERSKSTSLKLTIENLKAIFDAIDIHKNTETLVEVRFLETFLASLDLKSIKTNDISFPVQENWLQPASSPSGLSLNITSTKVKITTVADVDVGISMTSTSVVEMNMGIFVNLPLPSLVRESDRWQLTFPLLNSGVCRVELQEPLGLDLGAFHDFVPQAKFDSLKSDITRLVNQSLLEGCGGAIEEFSSFAEYLQNYVNKLLNKWQDEASNQGYRLLQLVNPPRRRLNSDSLWSVSSSKFVKQWRSFLHPFTDSDSTLHYNNLLADLKKLASVNSFTIDEKHLSSMNSAFESITLPGLGSVKVKLVEVQLHGLSSLEKIDMSLNDLINEDVRASVVLFGTFGMDIVVAVDLNFSEQNTEYSKWDAMDTLTREYKLSIDGLKNPSFGVDFSFVAKLLELDSALEAAFSPAGIFEAFWASYTNKDNSAQAIMDLMKDVLSRVDLECIVKHFEDAPGVSGSESAPGFQISKIAFDADEIDVHVTTAVGADESFQVIDQIGRGITDIFDIVYRALFKDNRTTMPKLIRLVLAASETIVNAYRTPILKKTKDVATTSCPSYIKRSEFPSSDYDTPLLQLLRSLKIDREIPFCARRQETIDSTTVAPCAVSVGFNAAVSNITLHVPLLSVKVSASRNSSEWSVQVRGVSAHVGVESVTIDAKFPESHINNLLTRLSAPIPSVGMDVLLSNVAVKFDSSLTPVATDIRVRNISWSSDDDWVGPGAKLDPNEYAKNVIVSVFERIVGDLPHLLSNKMVASSSLTRTTTNPPTTFGGFTFGKIFDLILSLASSVLPFKKALLLHGWRLVRDMLNDPSFLPTEPVQLDALLRALLVSHVGSAGVSMTLLAINVEESVSDITVKLRDEAVRVEWVGTVNVTLTVGLDVWSANDSLTLSVTNGGFELAGHFNMDHHNATEKMDLQRIFDAWWGVIVKGVRPSVSDLTMLRKDDFITISHVDFFGASIDARVIPSFSLASDAVFHFTAEDDFSLHALLESLSDLLKVSLVPTMLGSLNSWISTLVKERIDMASAPSQTSSGAPITADTWLKRADPMVRWSEYGMLEFADELVTQIIGPQNVNAAVRYPLKHKRWFQLPIAERDTPRTFSFPGSRWQIDMATPLLYSWDSPGDYMIKGVRIIPVTAANINEALQILVPRLEAMNSTWIVTGQGVVSEDYPVSGGDHLLQIRTSGDPSREITVTDVDNITNWFKSHSTVDHDLIFATPWNTTLRMADSHGMQFNATIEELQINGIDSMTKIEAPLVHMEEDVFLAEQRPLWYAYAGKPSLGKNRRVIEISHGAPDNEWVSVRIPTDESLVVIRNSRYSDADGVYRFDDATWRNDRGWAYNSTSHRLNGIHEDQMVREPVYTEGSKLGPYAVKIAASTPSPRSFLVRFDNCTVLEYTSASDVSNVSHITVNGKRRDIFTGSYQGVQFRFVKSRMEVEVRAITTGNITDTRSWTYSIMPPACAPYVEITSPETAVELDVANGSRVEWQSLGAIDTMLGAAMSLRKLELRAKVQVSLRETANANFTTFSLELAAQLSNVTADFRAVVEVLQSVEKLTTDQFLDFPCLLSHARNLTKIHTLDVSSSLQRITIHIGGDGTDISPTPFDQEAIRAFSHLFMSNYIIPAANAEIQKLLDDNRDTTCPTPPWYAPNDRLSRIFWWIFAPVSFFGFLVLIFGHRLCQNTKAALENAEPTSSSSVPSLHAHKEIPASTKIAMPILFIAYLCAFISSNANSGAIVAIALKTEDGVGNRTMASIPEFFSFTLIATVIDMWSASAYIIALAITVLCAVFPYGKLLILVLCWYAYSREKKWVTVRRQLLSAINFLSKWSLLDFLIATIFIASNRERFLLPPKFERAGENDSRINAEINYSVDGGFGLHSFIIASIVAYVLGYVMLAYHDRAVLADAIKQQQFIDDALPPELVDCSVVSLVDEANVAPAELDASATVPHTTAHRSIAVMHHASVRATKQKECECAAAESNATGKSWFQRCSDCGCRVKDAYLRVESGVMFALLLLSVILLFVGSFLKVVVFEVHGLAGWLLNGMEVEDERATYHSVPLSVWDVANGQLATLDHERTWEMHGIKTLFLLLTVIGPMMYFLCLMLLWVVPLKPRARIAAWSVVKLIDSAVNVFDVFIFTILVSTTQFHLVTDQIFDGKCDSLNILIEQIFGDVLTRAICVTKEGKFLPLLYLNIFIVLWTWVVNYRASMLIEREIVSEKDDKDRFSTMKTTDDLDSITSAPRSTEDIQETRF